MDQILTEEEKKKPEADPCQPNGAAQCESYSILKCACKTEKFHPCSAEISGTDFGATGEPDITVRHDDWGKTQHTRTV